jgi:hypothetical protein
MMIHRFLSTNSSQLFESFDSSIDLNYRKTHLSLIFAVFGQKNFSKESNHNQKVMD